MLFRRRCDVLFCCCLWLWQGSAVSETLQAAAPVLHVFYINLERSSDRKNHTERWLHQEGFGSSQMKRVDAIDAQSFNSTEITNELTLQVQLPCLQVRAFMLGSWSHPPVLAAGLSHAKAVAVAYAMGVSQALILEDDMEPVPLSNTENVNRPAELSTWRYIEYITDTLPAGWQVLQLSSLVYTKEKADLLGAEIRSGRLWSHRDRCSGASLTVWGAGAYIISRDGMEAFLGRYARPILRASVTDAKAFCGRIDLRQSAVGVVPDMLMYDFKQVYVSHLPVFRPAPDISAQSTVQAEYTSFLEGLLSGDWLQEARRLAVSIAAPAAAAAGSAGADATSGNSCPMPLAAEETCSDCAGDSHGSLPRRAFILFPDLLLHGHHNKVAHAGLPVSEQPVDVTSTADRLRFYALVDSVDARATPLWRQLLSTYFSECGLPTTATLSFDRNAAHQTAGHRHGGCGCSEFILQGVPIIHRSHRLYTTHGHTAAQQSAVGHQFFHSMRHPWHASSAFQPLFSLPLKPSGTKAGQCAAEAMLSYNIMLDMCKQRLRFRISEKELTVTIICGAPQGLSVQLHLGGKMTKLAALVCVTFIASAVSAAKVARSIAQERLIAPLRIHALALADALESGGAIRKLCVAWPDNRDRSLGNQPKTCLASTLQLTGSNGCTAIIAKYGTGCTTTCPIGTINTLYGTAGTIADCDGCAAGYYGHNGSITAPACTSCPSNTSNLDETSSTSATKTKLTVSSCTYPTAHWLLFDKAAPLIFQNGVHRSHMRHWSTSLQALALCTHAACIAGYYAADTAVPPTCTACAKGYVTTWSTSAGNTATSCSACPANQTTANTGASTCVCVAGAGGASSQCKLCAAGNYAVGGIDLTTGCTACAAGSFSAAGAATACTTCAKGTYATGTGNNICTACPSGSTTLTTAATASTDCSVCLAGYYFSATGTTYAGACLPCPIGYYKDIVGVQSTACSSCTTYLAGSTTVATASTSMAACVCAAGYGGTDGSGTCGTCPAGTYSPGGAFADCKACAQGYYANAATGATACIKCPGTGTTTVDAVGNTSITDCNACTAGYYNYDTPTNSCTPCAKGSFKTSVTTGTTATCTLCTSGLTTSSTASVSATACVLTLLLSGVPLVQRSCSVNSAPEVLDLPSTITTSANLLTAFRFNEYTYKHCNLNVKQLQTQRHCVQHWLVRLRRKGAEQC
ncbi:hypothetical protein JKP88DRAFT_253911 [Tribonema minus]|uniref:Tyrosine-protein kinase ephrin type A/B receptor-like domain-containing protein n=1 Tax=Tribonema minus TaxID=303371 RepID=A0A835Z841_9STRA|nr:hypothetical protein JKP88DRAFT_253911 [Tribonema minus]